MTGYKFDSFAKNAFKVIVDIDENEMNKFNIVADTKIYSDANEFILKLLKGIEKPNISKWRKHCKKLRSKDNFVFQKHRDLTDYASNYCFVEGLSKLVPSNIPTITSNGSAHVVTLQTMKLKNNQRLFTNVGCASMGYGLPASIGACFANGKNPVICIEGDGSLQMNIQELQVLVQNKIPIKLIVINNDGYACIKITQTNFCNGDLSLTNPSSGLTLPDYSKISNAYGLKYHSIKNREDLKSVFDNIFINDVYEGPELIELFVDPNEVHEPKVVAKLDENGKFIPGELDNINWLS